MKLTKIPLFVDFSKMTPITTPKTMRPTKTNVSFFLLKKEGVEVSPGGEGVGDGESDVEEGV